jgi:hypothetical protein
MRILIALDESLIIQAEKIEIGKGNHTSSSIIEEVLSVLPFLLLSILIFAYGNFQYQLFLEIVVSFSACIGIWTSIHNIFFKIGGRKLSCEYQICLNGYLLSYPQMQSVTADDDTNLIKGIDIVVAMNEDASPNSEDIFWPDETFYKVIVKLNSGTLCTIEENCIKISSSDANQIAFRKLIAETHSAIQQIKLFLAESSLSDS